MDWPHLLAYITGTVDQELPLRNEYLAAENRILRVIRPRLCLQVVRKAIEEAGGQLENVIRTRTMLTDISAWREAAQAHGECFSNITPFAPSSR